MEKAIVILAAVSLACSMAAIIMVALVSRPRPALAEKGPEEDAGNIDFDAPRLAEEIAEQVREEMEARAREHRIRIIAEKIDAYLARRGSPLAGYGRVFAEEGERTGINPYLSVAIAGKESSFGNRCFARFNAWGMLAFPQGFANWEEGIRANFEWLRDHYGAPRTAYDCPGYCVPDHPWMEHVQAVVRELERE